MTELAGPPVVDAYLKPEAVAKLLNVSKKTILRWVAKGKIPATKLPGGTYRFHPERLETWLPEVLGVPAG